LSATTSKKPKNPVIPELADGRKPLSGIYKLLAPQGILSVTTSKKPTKPQQMPKYLQSIPKSFNLLLQVLLHQ
jgi:hypothetical protein